MNLATTRAINWPLQAIVKALFVPSLSSQYVVIGWSCLKTFWSRLNECSAMNSFTYYLKILSAPINIKKPSSDTVDNHLLIISGVTVAKVE